MAIVEQVPYVNGGCGCDQYLLFVETKEQPLLIHAVNQLDLLQQMLQTLSFKNDNYRGYVPLDYVVDAIEEIGQKGFEDSRACGLLLMLVQDFLRQFYEIRLFAVPEQFDKIEIKSDESGYGTRLVEPSGEDEMIEEEEIYLCVMLEIDNATICTGKELNRIFELFWPKFIDSSNTWVYRLTRS